VPKLDITKFWDGTSRSFDLPPYAHEIHEIVMPLLGFRNDRIYPIGTCFMVSPLGLIMSATHNVSYGLTSLSSNLTPDKLASADGQKTLCITDFALYAFWQHVLPNKLEGMLWPLSYATQNQPGDIVFGRLKPATWEAESAPVRFKPLCLSPGMPRAGSMVFVVGYSEMPEAGSVTNVQSNSATRLHLDYSHRLSVSVGTVQTLYSKRRDQSIFCFPCFKTDAAIKPGFSGGPVFNEAGFVCGVACGEGVYESSGSKTNGFVSLIYPSLVTHLDIAFSNRRSGVTPLELIANSFILTDGSEAKAAYHKVGPKTHDWIIEYLHEEINDGYIFTDIHEQEGTR